MVLDTRKLNSPEARRARLLDGDMMSNVGQVKAFSARFRNRRTYGDFGMVLEGSLDGGAREVGTRGLNICICILFWDGASSAVYAARRMFCLTHIRTHTILGTPFALPIVRLR